MDADEFLNGGFLEAADGAAALGAESDSDVADLDDDDDADDMDAADLDPDSDDGDVDGAAGESATPVCCCYCPIMLLPIITCLCTAVLMFNVILHMQSIAIVPAQCSVRTPTGVNSQLTAHCIQHTITNKWFVHSLAATCCCDVGAAADGIVDDDAEADDVINDELDDVNDDDAADPVTQDNVRLKGEVARHKAQLQALQEKDPEFYAYLQQTDAELLGFGAGGEDADADKDDDDVMDDEDDESEQVSRMSVSMLRTADSTGISVVADSMAVYICVGHSSYGKACGGGPALHMMCRHMGCIKQCMV